MDPLSLNPYIDSSLAALKDFQKASVEALFEQFYENDKPHMLLADEVGLGKTVVARGLIAKVLKERLREGNTDPFRVTYICSNSVIARENLGKLNIFPKSFGLNEPIDRIASLAFKPTQRARNAPRQNLLQIHMLTPATSFDVRQGLGNRWERLAIYSLLMRDPSLVRIKTGLQWLLKGYIEQMERYRGELDDSLKREHQSDLVERFLDKINEEKIRWEELEVPYDGAEAPPETLRKVIEFIGPKLNAETWRQYWTCTFILARRLRRCLVDCCISYVEADLFILDEFQRFRGLIDTESEEEQTLLARRVFSGQRRQSRVLLLSATPFKALTVNSDLEQGEEHYSDLRKLLTFLLCEDAAQLAHYETHRHALYRQILELRGGEVDVLSPVHRQEVEKVLRSVMCRTERYSVGTDPNGLIADTWKDSKYNVPFSPGDVENYCQTDRIARALERIGMPVAKPVDFCKSAIYPLSFLDRYQIKERLRKHLDHPDVRKTLDASGGGWLDLEQIDRYLWQIDGSGRQDAIPPRNARLENLAEQAIGDSGDRLLWVPPSLPYYPLEDVFADTADFTKTLLFSSWVMVPRMVSTLISYEVERRTVGNPASVDKQEGGVRTYFTPEGGRRHPVPQIRYAVRRQLGEHVSPFANMSNFTLLYPSPFLADIVDPVMALSDRKPLAKLQEEAALEISQRLESVDWSRFIVHGREDERWYWAAPLLMDGEDPVVRQKMKQWFALIRKASLDRSRETESDSDGGVDAKQAHFNRLEQCLNDPLAINLGRQPEDLPNVLAMVALGSPAINAYRSLRRLFPLSAGTNEEDYLAWATSIADEFASLFNKPESIAAIRLSIEESYYWRMILRYCAAGCLQSVLDEYFHLLKGQTMAAEEAVVRLREAVNLNASVINVDSLDSFRKGSPRKMRCHYAVEFGSQRMESEEGQKRATNLREVFNSPFRPFLLATTSIGQEGLDFHHYCRRIVHWNLPSNPIDLEQREGRINRFKGHVIRQQLARKYGTDIGSRATPIEGDVWEAIFDRADRIERRATGTNELVPCWHTDAPVGPRIERVIPLYPFSKDRGRLREILKTLAVYRLAFGQPRQTELIEHLLERNLSEEEITQVKEILMINLSPIAYRPKKQLADVLIPSGPS